MRVAVDAMGGDRAPGEIVRGVVEAAEILQDVKLILVGDEKAVRSELDRCGKDLKSISIRHAPQIVEMGESPVEALRKKPDSSIGKAIELVAEREADAIVSAGNTGAVVVAATLSLRLLPGVRRPGIAVALPTRRGACTVMDVGANLNCRPKHLLQYGVMASVFSSYVVGRKGKPSVGLLNVGEEDAKGTDVIREAYSMLRDSKLNFVGNVEGRDIYRGNCDVVVCDGFVGNTILKLSEGLCETVYGILKDEMYRGLWRRLGAWMCRGALARVREKTDYSEYGGAFLLGIDGTCVICHGRSNARAIANAVRLTVDMHSFKVNDAIVAAISGSGGQP